jgi:Leucine-rich repeat (LRR) protein
MLSGCGTQQAPPAAAPSQTGQPPTATTPSALPPPAKTTVADDSGSVKFEIELDDPKAIVSIDGNDHTVKELSDSVHLKVGEHQLVVKHGARVIQTRTFTVVQGTRQILRIREPERVAAERVLELGGGIKVLVDGVESALPAKPFRITEIYLEAKPAAGDADLEHLHNLTALKTLHLARTSITDRTIEQIRGVTGLSHLNLGGTQVTDTGLEHIKDLKLGALTLSGTKVTDAGLVYLKNQPNLYYLDLGQTVVTDSGLQHLSGLTNLSTLSLDGTKVTDAGLVYIKDFQRLVVLGLSGTQVTDAGLVHVKRLPTLTNLNLSRTKVTDAGISELKGVQLKWLSLHETKVTDKALEQLREHKNLKTLELNGVSTVTDAGIAALKAALPNCEIVR